MSNSKQSSIYKDLDIRGKYPTEITDEEVKKIGQALVEHFGLKKVAVGRDVRPSADALFTALTDGLTESGADVIDLGLCTTPMTYYIGGSTDVDATIMITASHLPSDYNGLKITTNNAEMVTTDSLKIIQEIVGNHTFSSSETRGSITTHAMQPDWIKNFKDKHDLRGANLSVVIDPANMIGVLEIDTFKAFEPDLIVHTIFDEYDHSCPNHEANPVKEETLVALGKEVVDKKASIGVAFDGDADRVGFVDEKGKVVPSDIIGTLLSRYILTKYPKSEIIYDIRSSNALPEEVGRLGGKATRHRVGSTQIKTTMRETGAVFGAERSGHFFFKDQYFSEGGPLPAFIILELLKAEQKTLSQLVSEVDKYFQSGEINSEIDKSPEAIYINLKEAFPDGKLDTTDGLRMDFEDWWFNVRPSLTEPVMRLNLEAKTKKIMEEKRDQVLSIIRS